VTNDRWGVGVAIADYDNDGWPDIYVTNFGKNRLYHNNHDGTFTDVAEKQALPWVIGQPEPHGETMTAMAAWTFLSPATFTMTWRPRLPPATRALLTVSASFAAKT